jgi:membrane associated rhomboid family serine protease
MIKSSDHDSTLARQPGQLDDPTTRVVAIRENVVDIGMSLLLLMVLIGQAMQSMLVLPIVYVIGVTTWHRIKSWFRPPYFEIGADTLTFENSFVHLATAIDNMADVRINRDKLCLLFHDPSKVKLSRGRLMHTTVAGQHGYHFAVPLRVFPPTGLVALSRRLGLESTSLESTALQMQQFESQLARLTPRTYVVPALLFVNIVVFLWMLVVGEGFSFDQMIAWGANFGPLTTQGQWWRLLTSVFVHFGLLHVFFNCSVLWQAGRFVERLLGGIGFALMYLASGFAGSVASILWYEDGVVSAGASGAIFGVIGAILGVLAIRHQQVPINEVARHRSSVIAFVLFNLLLGAAIPWIDLAAHVGGFITGILCGALLSRNLAGESFLVRVARPTMFLVIFASVGVLAVSRLPAHNEGLVGLAWRIDETNKEAAELIVRLDGNLASGAISPKQAADEIHRLVVTQFDALIREVTAVDRRADTDHASVAKLMQYASTLRDGWKYLAQGLEDDDVLYHGLAVEKFEKANELSGTDTIGQSALLDELGLCVVAEQRASRAAEDLASRFEQGDIEASEFATLIEQTVLGPWHAAAERFAERAPKSLDADNLIIEYWTTYMRLRGQSWTVWCDAVSRGNQTPMTEVAQLQEQASEARNRVFPVPSNANPAQP